MLRNLARILGMMLLLSVCGSLAFDRFVRDGNPFVRTLTGADSSPSTELVTVKMGAVVLRIPRNYFWSLPRHEAPPDNPDQVGFLLMTLLPDFEPRTAENAHEFDRRGWGRKALVHVSFKGDAAAGKRSFEIQRSYMPKDLPILNAELGYKKYDDGWREYMFKEDGIDKHSFIMCSKQRPEISPSCEKSSHAGKDVVINYSFSRIFLADINDIESRLLARLNSFRISGPALEFVE